ncbi:MAG: hypothetical protein R3E88_21205 [Myxococcota bacterium]
MTKFEYDVLLFRQQEKSPLQLAFVAPADDLLTWAGIPRKSDELLTGFQRFRDKKRVDEEIVPFFQDDKNCSPTALIVALRKEAGLGRCSLSDDAVEVGEVKQARLTIEVDTAAFSTTRVFEEALQFVRDRNPALPGSGEDAEDADETEGLLDDEDDDTDEIVHLGTETLAKMRELLEDKSNWSNDDFRSSVVDFVKPAFLIDGQHRATAAARLGEHGLPFMVCGLYDASWPEQVFQFTVVNLKPVRIKPSLITSIAALSLTREEHREVETRLENAGIGMREVSVMSLVAYDDASPFSGMIAMAVSDPKQERELLGYGAAKRIANAWYRATRTSLTQIARQLFASNNSSNARKEWRDQRVWFDFFVAFWTAVRDHYSESLWQKSEANKLFVGANLWALQEAVLSAADGQMASHWKVPDDEWGFEERSAFLKERLLEVVTTMLSYVPEQVWTHPWNKASQDTTQGRDELVKLFTRFIDSGKKGSPWKGWRNDEWFKRSEE